MRNFHTTGSHPQMIYYLVKVPALGLYIPIFVSMYHIPLELVIVSVGFRYSSVASCSETLVSCQLSIYISNFCV